MSFKFSVTQTDIYMVATIYRILLFNHRLIFSKFFIVPLNNGALDIVLLLLVYDGHICVVVVNNHQIKAIPLACVVNGTS